MPDQHKNTADEDENVDQRLNTAWKQAARLRRRAEMLKKFAIKYRDSSQQSLYGIREKPNEMKEETNPPGAAPD
ncbi:MAG: hypothetical protein ACLFUB_19050 [Cyclobacteriaceae bacterium]